MKEKLSKNHYKGFDHRVKIISFCSLGALFVAICTFLPLTAVLQTRTYQIEAQNKQNQPTSAEPEKAGRIKLVYPE